MKKNFSLLPILKIREYKEQVQLQELAEASKEDRKLAAEYRAVQDAVQKVTATFAKIAGESFANRREIYDFFSVCEEKKRLLIAKRKILEPSIRVVKEKYNKAHQNAEVLRILQKKHKKRYISHMNKKFFEDLQEKSIWQSKLQN